MSVIHLNQIKNKITTLFEAKIDLAGIRAADRQNHFLSRALAAYAVHYLAHADVDDAAKAITDGFDDNGIDAIYYDIRERRLYLVQSKWIHSGTGEPENGDVKKFTAGIRDLVNLSFERFNAKVNANRELLEKVLYDPSTRYEAVIVYPSVNPLSQQSARDLTDLASEMNDPSEMLTVTSFIQADLYRSLTAGISGEPISLEVILKSWGRIETPHAAIYGQVDGQQIGSWWEKHRTRLFAKNLRGVLGDTDVNNEIRDTIESQPALFWYFNNGITIIAKKVKKAAAGGGDNVYGVFHCDDVSVVNGAQTVGAIGKYGESGKTNHHNIAVPVRIISLEDSHAEFGEAVTKTNNRQNRIENRDFVALDPEQTRIRTELALENIEYHVLREESASRTGTAFDLVESTTALSCASGNVTTVVQLKREIGKLWENIDKVPYKELFNGSVTGMYIWRCVRMQRAIDLALETILREVGPGTGREYGIAIHGNRILSALVFDQMNIKTYKDPQAVFDSLLEGGKILDATRSNYGRLKTAVAQSYGNAIIPTLFKNVTKCKELRTKCQTPEIELLEPLGPLGSPQ
jgi:AIPR protein